MTWTTASESAHRARGLIEEGVEFSTLYKLALYALTRSGASESHRALAAGYLNLYDRSLDTASVGDHS